MCNWKYNVLYLILMQKVCMNIFSRECTSWRTKRFNHFSEELFIENVTHFVLSFMQYFWAFLVLNVFYLLNDAWANVYASFRMFSFLVFSLEITSYFLYYEICKKSISCNICAQRCNPTIFYLEIKMQTLKWLIELIIIFIAISV